MYLKCSGKSTPLIKNKHKQNQNRSKILAEMLETKKKQIRKSW